MPTKFPGVQVILLKPSSLTHLIPSHSVVLVLRQFPSSKSYLINPPRYEIDLGNQLSYEL